MNMKDIMVRLALLAEQSGEQVTEIRLKFLAEKLFPYGADEVCEALERLLETSRRFPTVAEVKTAMGVAEPTGRDLGNHVANLMVSAMSKFGSLNGKKQATALKLALGDAIWDIVERQGGWDLCIDRANANLSGFIAQTRDLVESYAASGMIDAEQVPKHLPPRHDAFALAEKQIALLESKQSEPVKEIPEVVSGGFADIAQKILNGGIGEEK